MVSGLGKITAEVGLIRVGYQMAASIRNCVLTRNQVGLGQVECELTADVIDIDDYWATQFPIRLGIRMGLGCWWVFDSMMVVGEEPIRIGKMVAIVTDNPVIRHTF